MNIESDTGKSYGVPVSQEAKTCQKEREDAVRRLPNQRSNAIHNFPNPTRACYQARSAGRDGHRTTVGPYKPVGVVAYEPTARESH